MYEFKLYRDSEYNFPTEIELSKKLYPINTDFRVILNCIAVEKNTKVSDMAKNLKIISLFYKDKYPNPDPLIYYNAFINRAEKPDGLVHSEPDFDYLFDSDVIWVSFLKEYKIDLFDIEYLHWYKFLMLCENLSTESPLMERVHLRNIDTKDYKGIDKVKIQRAKRKIALPKTKQQEQQSVESVLNQFGGSKK